MELPAGQLVLGGGHVLAQLDEAEGQTPAPPALLLVGRQRQLGLLPCLVGRHQFWREAHDLPAGQRRELAAHGQRAVGPGFGHVELAAPGQRPHERGVPAAPRPEAQGLGGAGQVEVEALG